MVVISTQKKSEKKYTIRTAVKGNKKRQIIKTIKTTPRKSSRIDLIYSAAFLQGQGKENTNGQKT